jgi:16S rRNA (cytosine967-C5)-methyltransferase
MPPTEATAAHSLHVRRQAYKLLLQTLQATPGTFRLDVALRQSPLTHPADQRWLRSHVYGCLRHWWQMAHWLQSVSNTPLHKLDAKVRVLLQLGAYWGFCVTDMPLYAAVQQIGAIAKAERLPKHLVGFCNAVLRKLDPCNLPPVQHALPPWLAAQTPPAQWASLGQTLLQPPPLGLRLRPHANALVVQQELTQAGWHITPNTTQPDTLWSVTGGHGLLTECPSFKAGEWVIQEASSAQLAWALPLDNPTYLVDACAGLGMKTLALADRFPMAHIVALEPDATRFAQLQANLARCQLTHRVTALHTTAQAWHPRQHSLHAVPNCVLVDAPCSASGTVRRHPELMLNPFTQLTGYTQTQQAILTAVQGYGAPLLAYSTCSVFAAENSHTVDTLVAQGLRLLDSQQIAISDQQDGFYIAILSK